MEYFYCLKGNWLTIWHTTWDCLILLIRIQLLFVPRLHYNYYSEGWINRKMYNNATVCTYIIILFISAPHMIFSEGSKKIESLPWWIAVFVCGKAAKDYIKSCKYYVSNINDILQLQAEKNPKLSNITRLTIINKCLVSVCNHNLDPTTIKCPKKWKLFVWKIYCRTLHKREENGASYHEQIYWLSLNTQKTKSHRFKEKTSV